MDLNLFSHSSSDITIIMTWLLAALWLIITGFNLTTYVPNVNVDTWSDEYQINYQEVQRQIISEDFFTFATALGNYTYARGCAWWYGPDHRDAANQKRNHCSRKAFDCAGVIKAYGFVKWILTREEIGRNNSATLYDFGQPIAPELAQRWDYTFRQLINGSGAASTHGAFVFSPLSGWVMEIFDGINGRFHDRQLILHCNDSYCKYNTDDGVYKIKFATNPLVEIAAEKWITVDAFVQTGTADVTTWHSQVVQYQMCMVDDKNPLGFNITLTWYPYDSEANRIVNRWYIRNHDKDMIATYLCENWGFNPNAVSQTNDHGLCQLNYTYNKGLIDWENWLDIDFQKQACLDKWNEADNKNIWTCYKSRKYYAKHIIDMTWGFWSINDK